MENYKDTYRIYQDHLIKLQQAAVNYGLDRRPSLERIARKLGMLGQDGSLIFDDEEDMPVFMDGLIYETERHQQTTISAFLLTHPPGDDIDRVLSQGMRKARFGLYRVLWTQPERGETRLQSLAGGTVDTTLINIHFSESAIPGLIVAMRILPLPEFSICSSVFFPFAAGKELRMQREWHKKTGIDRYAHMYKLSQKESIRALTQDLEDSPP